MTGAGLALALWAVATPLASSAAPAAEHELAARLRQRFEPILDRTIAEHELPGWAMAVVADGRVVYSVTRGVRSLETSAPLEARSLFHMASVTKPFVATALMQLAAAGKVDLDAPVDRYLPYFQLKDPRSRQVTPRLMLGHVSGMPDVEDYEWEKAVGDDGALERYVRSLGGVELIAAPGERFRYSNMAYEVLGDVIAKASGVSFEEYVKRNILQPLGMRDSTLLRAEVDPRLATAPHVFGDRFEPVVSTVYPYNRMHGPSSTLHSNILDMSRWALANLRRGELDGTRILPAAAYDVMWKPSGDATRPAVISWFLGEQHGHRTVLHSGGDTGYRSQIVLLPDDGMALVWMCHSEAYPGGLGQAALDVVLGVDPKPIPRPLATLLGRIILDKGVAEAVSRYRKLKQEDAAGYDFREATLNRLGYALLGRGRTGDAVEILKLNVEAYPDSGNTYDSLGEACLKHGDRVAALANYRRSLERDPTNANAARKIQELDKQ